MRNTTTSLALMVLIGASTVMGGCVKRKMLAFDDNPKQALTTMQVMTTKNYWLWATAEHQFFTCSDKGNSLECKRACGGTTDLICPMGAVVDGVAYTRIR